MVKIIAEAIECKKYMLSLMEHRLTSSILTIRITCVHDGVLRNTSSHVP